MKAEKSITQLAIVSLIGLAVLHLVQLGAMFAQIEVAPPQFVGPLLGAAIAMQVATIPMILWQHKTQLWWLIIVVLMAIPSVGPHKFVTEADALIISPMILFGTIFLAILVVYGVSLTRPQESSQPMSTANR